MAKKSKTLEYIARKYNLNLNQNLPIEIPNTGRDTLPLWFRDLDFKIGAEIGVQTGAYSEKLCELNPGVKLFCIDPWQEYKGYREYVKQKKINLYFEEAKSRLASYDATLIQAFSSDAVTQFEDNSLDFVYIDGNHSYTYVLQDIELWNKKIRNDGIIAGHDYIKRAPPSTHNVIGAVKDYTKNNNINPWFLLGREAKNTGEIRDQCRSWFWVKGK